MAAAAMIIILVGVALVFLLDSKRSPDTQELFAQYYKPYPDVLTTKSGQLTDAEKLLFFGLQHYSAGQMDSAIVYFEAIEKEDAGYNMARFYEANCLLSLNKDIDSAIKFLEASSMDPNLKEQSNWYLALAFLKLNDPETSGVYLENLQLSNSPYKEKARELSGKLFK